MKKCICILFAIQFCLLSQVFSVAGLGSYEKMDEFANIQVKKHNMKLLGTCIYGILVDHKPCTWCFKTMSQKKMTLDAGKKLANQMVAEYCEYVTTNPEFRKHTLNHRKNQPIIFHHDDLNPAQIGFKVAFWDEDVNRPKKPHLAEIRFVNKQIHYYVANNETQALEVLLIEDLDEKMTELFFEKTPEIHSDQK